MPIYEIVFFVFSLIMLGAAVAVISVRNPVYAALNLVLAFFSAAAIWMLLEVEFLAIILILVYVGAVMVLFLFVVMMLDINTEPLREGFIRYLPVGVAVAALMLFEMFLIVGSKFFGPDQVAIPARHPEGYSNTEALGEVLYTVYMYPFEIAAVILLVAIVAAIGLTMRRRPDTKYQDPARQVRIRKGPDRIQVVSMPAEKRIELE